MGGDTSSVTYSSSDDECLSTIDQQFLDRLSDIILSSRPRGLSDKTTEENKSVFTESDARSFRDSYNTLEIKDNEKRMNNVYAQLLKKYDELKHRAVNMDEAKSKILSYTPGSWIENVGGMTMSDYHLPKTTTLLLIGPKGSGKSSLINRISRVFEDDKFAPERAQVSYNSSIDESGTFFLQEYMIPRNSTSFCMYDTRSFSNDSSENVEMIKRWMTKGVSHKELVDSSSLQATTKPIDWEEKLVSYEKRKVNFVIFVVNGLSVLKCVESDGADTQYTHMVAEVFSSLFLSFKDREPAIAITHGDLLSVSERARVRVYLGELLKVHPIKQTFDIPDNNDPTTELTIVDLVRHALEHADRNLPRKSRPLISKDRCIQLWKCLILLLYVGMLIFIARSDWFRSLLNDFLHVESVPKPALEVKKVITDYCVCKPCPEIEKVYIRLERELSLERLLHDAYKLIKLTWGEVLKSIMEIDWMWWWRHVVDVVSTWTSSFFNILPDVLARMSRSLYVLLDVVSSSIWFFGSLLEFLFKKISEFLAREVFERQHFR